MDVAGELTIADKSVVERIIATGRAIGGNGGGGSIVLYCGYCDFGLRDRPGCTCNAYKFFEIGFNRIPNWYQLQEIMRSELLCTCEFCGPLSASWHTNVTKSERVS